MPRMGVLHPFGGFSKGGARLRTYDLNKGKLCETLCAALRNDILTGAIASGERLPPSGALPSITASA